MFKYPNTIYLYCCRLPLLFIMLYMTTAFVGLFTLTVHAQNENREKKSYREEMKEKVKAELERRSKVLKWARTENPSQKKIFRRLHKPLLEGTREDYKANMRLAEKFRERATKAREDDRREAYERHKEIALAFRELAECNKKIHGGIKEGDGEKKEEAIEKVTKLEKTIMELTDRRPPRSWLTPEELRRYRPRRDRRAEKEE